MRTLIHLVRHADVENPGNVWYGRLEGFVLSERGLRQTQALAAHFAGHDIKAIYSSPLERAMQTAKAIADSLDSGGSQLLAPTSHTSGPLLPPRPPLSQNVQIDEDLIESETKLQGMPGDMRLFRNPLNLRHFVNPLRPSWGEPYASLRERLGRAVTRIRDAHSGSEAIAVSHMTPILVARLMFEENLKPPWRAGLPCGRASVTTIEFEADRYVSTRYEPVGASVV